MNDKAPFTRKDLDDLDRQFLNKASSVVSLREVHAGNRHPDVIGLRHDCDSGASLATARQMALWEAKRGYRSTYFVLHTSPYWQAPGFRETLEDIALLGHEIGIHSNALAEALRTGLDPDEILHEAIDTLHVLGHTVCGVAGHGDSMCREANFANDEQFVECARWRREDSTRTISRGDHSLTIQPRPLADFGLDYEALDLGMPLYWRVSDSGGQWKHGDNPTFQESAAQFAQQMTTTIAQRVQMRQLHMLVHPDWWAEAFPDKMEVAA